jgi:hypothetical protein
MSNSLIKTPAKYVEIKVINDLRALHTRLRAFCHTDKCAKAIDDIESLIGFLVPRMDSGDCQWYYKD